MSVTIENRALPNFDPILLIVCFRVSLKIDTLKKDECQSFSENSFFDVFLSIWQSLYVMVALTVRLWNIIKDRKGRAKTFQTNLSRIEPNFLNVCPVTKRLLTSC